MEKKGQSEEIARSHMEAQAEAEHHNRAFRGDLIELLRKHALTAEDAVARLIYFCNEILCHFNTQDLLEYKEPLEKKYIDSLHHEEK